MSILLFLISAIAFTLASIAFQIGLATGHFKSYEWAMWPLFIASGILWLVWAILAVRHYRQEQDQKRRLPPPPPAQTTNQTGPHIDFKPSFTVSPSFTRSAALSVPPPENDPRFQVKIIKVLADSANRWVHMNGVVLFLKTYIVNQSSAPGNISDFGVWVEFPNKPRHTYRPMESMYFRVVTTMPIINGEPVKSSPDHAHPNEGPQRSPKTGQ
jgi:hypothetical protein